MRLVIVSGLSGAGKSVALKQYEDLGYNCIDNLPLDLVQPLIDHAIDHPGPRYRLLALGIDARCDPREIERFPAVIEALRATAIDVRVLFLSAEDRILLQRFNETRRRHPLSGPEISLIEAIRLERRLLRPVADLADVPIDTSRLNFHELRQAIEARLPEAGAGRLALLFLSFGFKHGGPEGADFVFDVRCLPNPHWVPGLRTLDGRDAAVADYLERHTPVGQLLDDIRGFLERWLPAFQAQDRAYVTIALGCTGGQHRSVFMAERLGAAFRERFEQVVVKHRELSE